MYVGGILQIANVFSKHNVDSEWLSLCDAWCWMLTISSCKLNSGLLSAECCTIYQRNKTQWGIQLRALNCKIRTTNHKIHITLGNCDWLWGSSRVIYRVWKSSMILQKSESFGFSPWRGKLNYMFICPKSSLTVSIQSTKSDINSASSVSISIFPMNTIYIPLKYTWYLKVNFLDFIYKSVS